MDKMDKQPKKPVTKQGKKEDGMSMSGPRNNERAQHDSWDQTKKKGRQGHEDASSNAKRSR